MSLKKSRTKSLSLGSGDDDDGVSNNVVLQHAMKQQQQQTVASMASAATPPPSAGAAAATSPLSLARDGLRNPQQRPTSTAEDTSKILKLIDDNIIGKGAAFLGPFGRRKVVYADYCSSGRSLQFLEDYVQREVLPAHGDMSCTSAVTGLQSQLFYKEVRNLARTAVNATAEDEIIFCDGNYASPIERLCYLLCSTVSAAANANPQGTSSPIRGNSSANLCAGGGRGGASSPLQFMDDLPMGQGRSSSPNGMKTSSSALSLSPPPPAFAEGPILFVSTCEIIQNLQPWIDAGAQIERVAKNREGFLDLDDLAQKLAKHQHSRRRLIGLFSAASRLTGILADDVATTILLHQFGAISLWDYSYAAPFAPIITNPPLPGASKDVVFFTTSKFIGGVQAPGIMVVKKALLSNLNVSTFNENVGVIGAVRAGLVIQLKESLGVQNIMNRQEKMCKQILAHIRTIPEIVLLGPNSTTAKRLATICFLVKHPRGTFLHNRFVVAVLNDVFGIQATAGPHIGYAMGITEKLTVDYERLLMDESGINECLRPGYTRISLPYFMADQEVAFIMEALKMVATEAWKLLPQYECDNETGEWRHHSNSLAKERKWLGAIRYTDGKMLFADRKISGPGAFPQNYAECLHTARILFNRSRKMAQKSSVGDSLLVRLTTSVAAEALRWYMLPGEAHELLIGHFQNVKNVVPFDPNKAAYDPFAQLIMHRHNSLSALDIRKFKSRSLPLSPVQIPRHHQSTTPSPTTEQCLSPPIVRFSLGGEVTTNLVASATTQPADNGGELPGGVGGIMANSSSSSSSSSSSGGTISRHRCNSWTASALFSTMNRQGVGIGMDVEEVDEGGGGGVGVDILNDSSSHIPIRTHMVDGGCQTPPQTPRTPPLRLFSQQPFQSAIVTRQRRRRVCSCSSQTDLSQMQYQMSSGIESPTPSLNSLCQVGSSINDPLDIQAYVKEVTQDIATEIKSELREVILKVDNVLDNSSDQLDMLATYQQQQQQYQQQLHYQQQQQGHFMMANSAADSVSAADVAEYLKEFSKEITSEVKSEIREACRNLPTSTNTSNSNNNNNNNTCESPYGSRKNSPPEMLEIKSQQPQKPRPLDLNLINNIVIMPERPFNSTGACDNDNSNYNDNNNNKMAADGRRYESFPCRRPQSATTCGTAPATTTTTSDWPQVQHMSGRSSAGNNNNNSNNNNSNHHPFKYTGAISKLADTSETASRDSGINMCFPEMDNNTQLWPRNRILLVRPESLSMDSSSELDEQLPLTPTAAATMIATRMPFGESPLPGRSSNSSSSNCSSNLSNQFSNTISSCNSSGVGSSYNSTTTTQSNSSNNSSSIGGMVDPVTAIDDDDDDDDADAGVAASGMTVSSGDSGVASGNGEAKNWHNLPKEVWKPASEVKTYY